jgi:hypothetical protein
LIYTHLREDNPHWKERLASKLFFESSRENPRIQVADLFAREAMKALDNEIGPTKRPIRKSWQALRETGRFQVESFSKEYFGALKNDLPNLHELFAFNPEDFQAWQTIKKRQWNLTNYFEFLRWHRKQMAPEQLEELNARLGR